MSQDAVENEVAYLADGEHDADCRGAHHEVGEDFLFGGPGDVAVHGVGTGGHADTLDEARHLETPPQGVQQVEKEELDEELEDQTEQVGPPEATVLLARVAVQLGTLVPMLQAMLALTLLSVGHMQDDQERGACDKDELQGPEADVGDGEEVVVADVGAARLPGVAVKVLLFISPYTLCSHHVYQHTEDEHY